MATIKSYTDLEQSKKLAKILPLESADMHYKVNRHDNKSKIFMIPYSELGYYKDDDYHYSVCAWSLAALLGVLQIYTTPTAFSTNISVPSLIKTKNGYSITYVGDYRIMESNNNGIEAPIEIVADNSIDTCYEMILKLHELKLL